MDETLNKRCSSNETNISTTNKEVQTLTSELHRTLEENATKIQETIKSRLQTEKDWVVIPTLVESGASIGTGAVIMCGVLIGAGALIGAGSVVTKNVEKDSVVVGNPANLLR